MNASIACNQSSHGFNHFCSQSNLLVKGLLKAKQLSKHCACEELSSGTAFLTTRSFRGGSILKQNRTSQIATKISAKISVCFFLLSSYAHIAHMKRTLLWATLGTSAASTSCVSSEQEQQPHMARGRFFPGYGYCDSVSFQRLCQKGLNPPKKKRSRLLQSGLAWFGRVCFGSSRIVPLKCCHKEVRIEVASVLVGFISQSWSGRWMVISCVFMGPLTLSAEHPVTYREPQSKPMLQRIAGELPFKKQTLKPLNLFQDLQRTCFQEPPFQNLPRPSNPKNTQTQTFCFPSSLATSHSPASNP